MGHIISSFPQHQPSSMHVLALACYSSSYHCGKKVWKAMEGKTMEVLRGDKEPLRDNRCATHRKLYLRYDSGWFNASSLLVLYAQISKATLLLLEGTQDNYIRK